MSTILELNEKEVEQLDLMIKQALNTSLVELHHTATREFKECVKARITLLEGLSEKVERVLHPMASIEQLV